MVSIDGSWQGRCVVGVSGVWRAVGSQVVAEVSLLTCESSELQRFFLVTVMQNEILRFDTIIVGKFWQVYS